MVVLKSLSPKNFFSSCVTCCARLVRSSYMVNTTPSTSSGGFRVGADTVHGVEQFADAFKGEVFRLHGNEDRIRHDQRIQREQIQRGRTVEDDVLKTNIGPFLPWRRNQLREGENSLPPALH